MFIIIYYLWWFLLKNCECTVYNVSAIGVGDSRSGYIHSNVFNFAKEPGIPPVTEKLAFALNYQSPEGSDTISFEIGPVAPVSGPGAVWTTTERANPLVCSDSSEITGMTADTWGLSVYTFNPVPPSDGRWWFDENSLGTFSYYYDGNGFAPLHDTVDCTVKKTIPYSALNFAINSYSISSTGRIARALTPPLNAGSFTNRLTGITDTMISVAWFPDSFGNNMLVIATVDNRLMRFNDSSLELINITGSLYSSFITQVVSISFQTAPQPYIYLYVATTLGPRIVFSSDQWLTATPLNAYPLCTSLCENFPLTRITHSDTEIWAMYCNNASRYVYVENFASVISTLTTNMATTALQTTAIQTTALQTTAIQTTALQTTALQTTAPALITTALQTTALQTTALQTTAPALITTALQTTALQTTAAAVTTALQTTALQTTALQTTGDSATSDLQTTAFRVPDESDQWIIIYVVIGFIGGILLIIGCIILGSLTYTIVAATLLDRGATGYISIK